MHGTGNFDLSSTEEHVAGDSPDTTKKLGRFDLTRNAYRVRVPYRDQAVYCEVYLHTDGSREIHWLCPRCQGGGNGYMSRIHSSRKQIDFSASEMPEAGGRLNVERFSCPWEAGENRRMEFGLGTCRLELVIDNSVARDA